MAIINSPEGRALLAICHKDAVLLGVVSILARPEGRALLPVRIRVDDSDLEFQSSPAPKDGRYRRTPATIAQATMFQSSPAPKDGRYSKNAQRSSAGWKFQSSPAPKDGRYPSSMERPTRLACVFQSSPAPKDGRYPDLHGCKSRSYEFQSSPAPKDGRYFGAIPEHLPSYCFNPRPPRRTGATETGDLASIVREVSILARPEGRALLTR